VVCDGGYFCLDNLAAVEAYPDAGAYAVVHVPAISVLAPWRRTQRLFSRLP
jgi:hypothetical protein